MIHRPYLTDKLKETTIYKPPFSEHRCQTNVQISDTYDSVVFSNTPSDQSPQCPYNPFSKAYLCNPTYRIKPFKSSFSATFSPFPPLNATYIHLPHPTILPCCPPLPPPGLTLPWSFCNAASAASSLAVLTYCPSYQYLAGTVWPLTLTVQDQAVRLPRRSERTL